MKPARSQSKKGSALRTAHTATMSDACNWTSDAGWDIESTEGNQAGQPHKSPTEIISSAIIQLLDGSIISVEY